MARSAGDLCADARSPRRPGRDGIGIAHRLALRPARHETWRTTGFSSSTHIRSSRRRPSAARRSTASHRSSASAGARVERRSDLLPDLVEAARLYMRLLLASIAAAYPPEATNAPRAAADRVAPDDLSLAAERARGAVLSYRDWVAADAVRAATAPDGAQLFTEFDIVVMPAAPTTAFGHDQSPDQWARTDPDRRCRSRLRRPARLGRHRHSPRPAGHRRAHRPLGEGSRSAFSSSARCSRTALPCASPSSSSRTTADSFRRAGLISRRRRRLAYRDRRRYSFVLAGQLSSLGENLSPAEVDA